MSPSPSDPRRRKLNAWGFEGESFPLPRPMRKWLERHLGKAERCAAVDPGEIPVPAPRPLPHLPAAVSQEDADRILHARGRGFSDLVRLRTGALPALPDAVVRPGDAREVEAVLGVCSREGVRVIPFGGGTSVTGGVNTQPGPAPTVVLDLERLSGLAGIDERSGLAVFGAGTLGHFPQSWELSTIGGWAATRSCGPVVRSASWPAPPIFFMKAIWTIRGLLIAVGPTLGWVPRTAIPALVFNDDAQHFLFVAFLFAATLKNTGGQHFVLVTATTGEQLDLAPAAHRESLQLRRCWLVEQNWTRGALGASRGEPLRVHLSRLATGRSYREKNEPQEVGSQRAYLSPGPDQDGSL
jgi:hypothetical protein